MSDMDRFFERAGALLDRLEVIVPAPGRAGKVPEKGEALRWSGDNGNPLHPIRNLSSIELADLQCIERQKHVIERNTRQFVNQLPSNNALLWGPRGTGKSSLVKAVFNACRETGLRLVEIPRERLTDLSRICDLITQSEDRFLVYCDDLSFESGDPGFSVLKAALDGAAGTLPENMLIYATSNRRHLVPEYMHENRNSRIIDGELHLNEAIEEKISLSERFGIWLSFHPFDQDQYLQIVNFWIGKLGATVPDREALRTEALQWALERGSRSGRSAWQFARDWTGKQLLSSS